MGDKSALCPAAAPIGRITFGLYGEAAPSTVANFTKLIKDRVYDGTIFHKVLPGKYVKAGKQGSKRYGEVDSTRVSLPANQDLVSSKAFATPHSRAGTLSLAVSENDDQDFVKSREGYEPTEFIITTGPSPAFDLDNGNIVFGRVVEGLDVLSEVAAVPTIKANDTLETYNAIASFLGDDRAAKARQKWGKPLEAIVIMGSGVV